MIRTAILILALFFLAPFNSAWGETRGFLYVGDLNQRLDFIYNYSSQSSSGTNQQSRDAATDRLEEKYHLDFAYAIYDPRLLKGRLGATLRLNQDWSSFSGSPGSSNFSTDIDYNITGVLLGKKPVSFTFDVSNTNSHFSRDFAGSYDVSAATQGFGAALKNSMLPVQISYSQTSSETSGLVHDTIQHYNQALVVTSNNYKRSDTHLTLQYLQQDLSFKDASAPGTEQRTGNLDFSNLLTLGSGPGRTLNTVIRITDMQGTSAQNTTSITENLIWLIGKALQSSLTYSINDLKTPTQKQDFYTMDGWLQHKLFESLTTRLSGNFTRRDMTTGNDQSIGGVLSLSYVKNISFLQSVLSLRYVEGYQITDRNFTSSSVHVFDEPHKAPSLTGKITLVNSAHLIPSSIKIRNADPTSTYFTRFYDLNVDYTVDSRGDIRLVATGNIVPDTDNLLISYDYKVSPVIKYDTTTRKIGATLAFLNDQYRIYGSRDQISQGFISGDRTLASLDFSTVYVFGFEGNKWKSRFGVEYVNQDASTDIFQSIEGFWGMNQNYGVNLVTLRVKDRYSIHDPGPANSGIIKGYTENFLTMGGTLQRPFFLRSKLTIAADYAKITGNTQRDSFNLSLGIQWRINKIHLTMNGTSSWFSSGGNTTRNDRINFQLTRYF